MAGTSSRNDPFLSFNFIVDIQGMKAGFSEVGGLSTETDVVEYRNGDEDITVRKLPGKRKYTNLTFKRAFTNSKHLWDSRSNAMDVKPQRLPRPLTLMHQPPTPPLARKS